MNNVIYCLFDYFIAFRTLIYDHNYDINEINQIKICQKL